jgi:hypothetical protein
MLLVSLSGARGKTGLWVSDATHSKPIAQARAILKTVQNPLSVRTTPWRAEANSMKKRTVITTEKREVWVVREAVPETDQPIDFVNAIEVQPGGDPELPEDKEREREK